MADLIPNVLSKDCPSRSVLDHLTSRWGVLILIVLMGGTHRFSELRRRIDGVSERMLAQTLQTLEADGMVIRTSYDVVPPHVDYRLSPLGQEAALQMKSLTGWIEGNLPAIMNAKKAAAR